jgi:surfactin synthase thioesterase subunit
LSPGVELRALQLPGRPPRRNEAPFESFSPLVDAIVEAIRPLTDKPFVFYGHSLGALTAYEVARKLVETGAPQPKHLFLAAYPAPHLVNPVREFHELPLQDLARALTGLGGIPAVILEDQELLAEFLPSIRADLSIVAHYRHAHESPLAIPATILGGELDDMVQVASLEQWRDHIRGPITVDMVSGGHLFVREAEREIMAKINAVLDQSIGNESPEALNG